jgi:shikimate kinase/3-dehydroquinate synthase
MSDIGPGIVLVGMPGSGKSTVGRLLAERLQRPFIDTDALFERRHGTPVPAYLRENGEPAFRRAEADAVAEACATRGAVIAGGGGAALDPLSRWALWHHGLVVWLDLPVELLIDRLRNSGTPRPSFEPYDAVHLAGVLDNRLPVYRAADLRVDATRRPGRLADEILARRAVPAGRRLFDAEVSRNHPIGPERARVVIGADLPLAELAPAGVAVVDQRAPLRPVARVTREVVGGERTKRVRHLERLLGWLAEQRVERDEALVAVGGGTVGDLAGTAAALYNRGLPLVHVPTTWLAQADSSIGGKVAVDLPGAKNSVGAFWPPVVVLTDVAALRTLPRRPRRDGIAETVKAALIGDPALWTLLETRGRAALGDDEAARAAMIERSVRLKLAVCERDPFEQGERRTLNLGHTIGHALEVASGYRLPHGSAVAFGMRAVAAIAQGRGGDADLSERLDGLLTDLGFRLRLAFDGDAVKNAMATDKKRRHGRQRWILPMAVGSVTEIDDVTDAELTRALRAITA